MTSLSLNRPLVPNIPSPSKYRIPCSAKRNQIGLACRFACKASAASSDGTGHDNQKNPSIFDRRDMLIGLGGLYGMVGLIPDLDIPWLIAPKPKHKSKSTNRRLKSHVVAGAAENKNIKQLSEFPITLDKTVSTVVRRPKKGRSKVEKEEAEEVLVIQGIEYDSTVPVKFDVLINDEDDDAASRADKAEFAGSFASVQSQSSGGKTELNLGISELLEDLDADDDETVVVSLVPRSGIGKVKIDGIKIELLS